MSVKSNTCCSHCHLCLQIPEVLLWAKEQNEEKSPNLTQFTEHFNNMSYWYIFTDACYPFKMTRFLFMHIAHKNILKQHACV